MTAQLPTRITIELHPGEGDAGWTAHTALDDGQPAVAATGVSAMTSAHVAEPREELPGPAAYEPAPCTCLDDDGCAADHANE